MLRRLGVLLILLVPAGAANATIGNNDLLVTGTGAYVLASSEQSETIDGAAFALTIEQLGSGSPVSFGLIFTYASVDWESNDAGNVLKQSVKSYPIYLVGKYWLGEGKLQGYVGGAFGVYFSRLEVTAVSSGNQYSSENSSGTGLSIPVGAALNISKNAAITLSYSLNFLFDNDYLKNGIVNSFGIGLALNVGE